MLCSKRMPRPRFGLKSIAACIAVALVYWIAARLGLSLAFATKQVTAVWPPSAIAVVALMYGGYLVAPGIFLGALFANLGLSEPIPTAIAISFGNTLGPVLGVWLFQRCRFEPDLDRTRNIFGLVTLPGALAMTITAANGTLSLAMSGLIPWSNFGSVFWVWWSGDTLGVILVAPVLLGWLAHPRLDWRGVRLLEISTLFSLLAVVGTAVFLRTTGYQIQYIVFPLVFWAALRFGQRETATAVALVAGLAVWGVAHDLGPFAQGTLDTRLILLQVFMAVMSIAALSLGAVTAERSQIIHQRELLRSKLAERTRLIANASDILTQVSLDFEAALQTTARMLGEEIGEACFVSLLTDDGEATWMPAVHHPDPEFAAAILAMAKRVPLNDSPSGQVVRSGEPLLIPTVRPEVFTAQLGERFQGAGRRGQVHSFLAVPIRVGERTIGAISLTRSSPSLPPYTEADQQLLQVLAVRAGAAIENARLHGQVARALIRAELLEGLSRVLAEVSLSLEQSLQAAVRLVAKHLGHSCAIQLLVEGGSKVRSVAIFHVDPEAHALLSAISAEPRRLDETPVGRVVQTGKSLLVENESPVAIRSWIHPQYREYIERFPVSTYIIAPLIVRNKVIGAISVQRGRSGAPYGGEDQTLLESLADRIAVSIENARLHEETEQTLATLDALYSAAPVGLSLVDTNLRYVRENNAMAALKGRKVADDLGQTITETIADPALASKLETMIRRVLETNEPIVNMHMQGVKPGGTEPHDLLSTWYPVRTSDGKAIGAGAVVVDVTGLRKAEEERDRTLAELQELARTLEERVELRTSELARSNAELEQFAYAASHDLQEPLRMVASYAQLLGQRLGPSLDPENAEFMSYVVEGAARMKRLIDDLLAYSRVTHQKTPTGSVPAEAVLANVLSNLRTTVDDSSAEVSFDPLPEVWCHQTQLGQLFQNLISNAIKFRGKSPPHIHISAREEPKHWLFSVKDNGIGIAPKYAQRIFTLFQRLHSRSQYPGTGLGLSICKKIVENLGGRIWVESRENEGAVFFFTIPKQSPENKTIG